MENEHLVHVLVQVLNGLLKPGVKINEEQVGRLVKCVTGIPGNRRRHFIYTVVKNNLRIKKHYYIKIIRVTN